MQKKITVFLLFFLCLFTAYPQQPRLVLPAGLTHSIDDISFLENNRYMFTSSGYGSFLWDVKSGFLITKYEGKEIASGYNQGRIVVNSRGNHTISSYDFKKEQPIEVLNYGLNGFHLFEPAPGNKLFGFTANEDKTTWGVGERKRNGPVVLKRIKEEYEVYKINFSNDGSKIFLSLTDGTVIVRDISTLRILNKIEHSSFYITIYPLKKNDRFIIKEMPRNIKEADRYSIWRVNDSKPRSVFSGQMLNINRTETLASLNSFDTVKVISLAEEKEIKKIVVKGLRHSIINENGSAIILAAINKKIPTISLRSLETDTLISSFNLPDNFSLTGIHLSEDEKIVAVSNFWGVILIYDLASGRLISKVEPHSSDIYLFNAFFKHNSIYVSSLTKPNIQVFNINDLNTKYLEIKNPDLFFVYPKQDNILLHDLKNNLLQFYNSTSFKPEKGIPIQKSYFSRFSSTDSVLALYRYDDSSFKVLDISQKRIARNIPYFEGKTPISFCISNDASSLITNTRKKTVLWNVDERKIEFEYTGVNDFFADFYGTLPVAANFFSPTGDSVLIYRDPLLIYSRKQKKIVDSIYDLPRKSYFNALFSPSGTEVILIGESKNAYIYHCREKTIDKSGVKHTTVIRHVGFSNDGKNLLTLSDDDSLKMWDYDRKALLSTTYVGPGATKLPVEVKENLWISHRSDRIIAHNLKTGKELFSLFRIDSTGFVYKTPEGYYYTNPSAAKLFHYVNKDLKIITFEQLDVKYNRPDKVLEAIGSSDTLLIKSYRNAWKKRVEKLGIDTASFRDGYAVPEADFIDRNKIEYDQTNEVLTLRIKAVDRFFKLDRFNAWINEVPLFGQRGIRLKGKKRNTFDTTINVILSEGENRIETSVISVNGTESFRMPLQVKYTAVNKKKEKLYFIGLGIDDFENPHYKLKYSVKDIRDLAFQFKQRYNVAIEIDTLFNEYVTVNNVKALKEKLLQSGVNDKVIIAYSGHGLLSRNFDYYLSTHDINFEKPEQNGLAYDALENLLDSIPARRKLMLIDACHSGEVDKDEFARLDSTIKSNDTSGLKGVQPLVRKRENQLGMKSSFELMQSLFVNVGKNTGAIIISAAAGTQFALERGDLKNGVFTYSILEAMNQLGKLKISELKKIVGRRVEELTKGLQKPTFRNETIAVDWEL